MVVYDRKLIVVRHLPQELSREEKIDLLKFFGATKVTCISSDRKKSSLVFAKFEKEQHAEAVLKKLHQADILGQLVSVEYARCEPPRECERSKENDGEDKNDEKTLQRKLVEKFQFKLNSWIYNLDLALPPPSHLMYTYPPPQLHVLKNISKALHKVPKFYTQVLHLMNKMNLPCPFVDNYVIEDENIDGEFDESEIESELEDDETTKNTCLLKPKSLKPKLKRLQKLVTPIAPKRRKQEPKIKPDEVFDVVNLTKKNIELHIPTDLTSSNELPQAAEKMESFEFEEERTIEDKREESVEKEDDNRIITEEELAMNCVPPKDFHLLPVFKNYQPGLPSCRLYIKNLAKTVQETDLNFIFKRYLTDEVEEQGSMFDVRLMQEGRMKGQAFITLQNTSLASKALKETNGFMLKGKPMVVQYARSLKPN